VNIKYNPQFLLISLIAIFSQFMAAGTKNQVLDVSHLSPAVYVLTLKNESGVLRQRKVVVY